MQVTNCPRCNVYLAPGAKFCPNCQLNLQQYLYALQTQQHIHTGNVDLPETRQESTYRKLLFAVVIVLMVETVLYRVSGYLYSWFGMNPDLITRPMYWFSVFTWGALPLVVGLVLPKKNTMRIPLIIIASLYAVWHIGTFIYETFLYSNNVTYGF